MQKLEIPTNLSDGSGRVQRSTTNARSDNSFELQSSRTSRLSATDTTVFEVFPRDAASSAAAMQPKQNTTMNTTTKATDNRLVVVGATCAVLGLLVGIALSVAFWIYKRRCGKKHRRKSSVLEKNPKEMTFEPLDLTLTLPKYESNLSSRVTSSRQTQSFSTLRYSNRYNDRLGRKKLTSYQSFELPSPPVRNRERQNTGLQLANEQSSDEFSSIHSSTITSEKTNTDVKKRKSIKQERRPITISTQESVSSGLGTCTESELCFSEVRTPQATGKTRETRFVGPDLQPNEPEISSPEDTQAKRDTSEILRINSLTEQLSINLSLWQSSTYPELQKGAAASMNSLPCKYNRGGGFEGNFNGFRLHGALSSRVDKTDRLNSEESDTDDTKTSSIKSISSALNDGRPESMSYAKEGGSYVTVIRRSSDATINL